MITIKKQHINQKTNFITASIHHQKLKRYSKHNGELQQQLLINSNFIIVDQSAYLDLALTFRLFLLSLLTLFFLHLLRISIKKIVNN